MDDARLQSFVNGIWTDEIVGRLTEYVRIPNLSPAFDPDWAAHGHMDRAVDLAAAWCRTQPVPGLAVEVVRLPGRTPLLVLEVPGEGEGTVLLYGHLDKQPEMTGWREGLGPFVPVIEGDRLYGRGGADDGYAVFASLTAIRAVHEAGGKVPRCVVLVECSEESGSPDLPAYVEHLEDRLGRVDLVICLDSGCGDYDRLWLTTSLRGLVSGTLTVEVLKEGVHSGGAGGIVPSTFRIVRALLSRVEDETTGRILPPELSVEIPAARRAQARATADVLHGDVGAQFPFVPGAHATSEDPVELLLANTWRPTIEVIGAAGLPSLEKAGNVLRPTTSVEVSVRVPPGCGARAAVARLKEIFEADPPYGARVTFEPGDAADGWNAPDPGEALANRLDEASRRHFGKPVAHHGEGGTIPFMAMLGERFPAARFVVTGVLGPGSNAHGPNEFLHLPTARRLTCCVAELLQR